MESVFYPFAVLERVLFVPASESTGLSEDKIRYVFLLFVAILLGFCMKHVLHPSKVNNTARHCYSFVCGMIFGLACFGFVQMMYLFAVVGICYAFLLFLPPKVVHNYTMVWMLVCISAAHVYRMITDYGGYHLDFTGPLMVIVQRTTYVAFALHDGLARKPSQLNEDQSKQRINQIPSLLEYLSYNFCFLYFLAGPVCTYKEYQDFIRGLNFTSAKVEIKFNQSSEVKEHTGEPSNLVTVLHKTMMAITFMILHVVLSGWFPIDLILVPNLYLIKRVALLFLVAFAVRTRYFFVWLMTDSACNAAGLGFSGYNKLGYAQWDLVSGVDVIAIEFGTSMRTMVNGWNMTTNNWLRRVCYDRVTFLNPVLVTFFLSAWWHGFYPAYYCLFVMAALDIMAARKMRRLLHHRFQHSLAAKWGYNVLTWYLSMLYLNICCMTIMTLHLHATIEHLSYYYFIPLVTPLIVIVLPIGQKSKRKENASTDVKEKQSEVVSKETKVE